MLLQQNKPQNQLKYFHKLRAYITTNTVISISTTISILFIAYFVETVINLDQ